MNDLKNPSLAAEVEALPVTEEKPLAAVKPTKIEKKPDNGAGFCVYLGPTIHHTIQAGTVLRGTKKEVLSSLAAVVEAHPLVASLIVTGENLPADRIKVRTPGNLLYVNYHKLAGKK